MQAVILAGGLGTRLKKILKGKPKCLAPIKDTTILGHQLKLISETKIKNVLVICHYRADLVKKYISEIKKD